ncbi:regenerating islet-derived protein 4 [Cavia porcellus]|uniref:Rerating family member 4 n=1 Tax=Cavia porcellus TaxID=10141 RepID=H0W0T9_CAVPO|nr:regenerating islet-derived protein 4 [Cavia porcellus]
MASKGWCFFLLLSWVARPKAHGDIWRPSCAPGWFYYKSNCYGYFWRPRTWFDAEIECQSYGYGTHLASVLSHKEASVISKYISGYQRNQPVWIGLHDPQQKELWQWLDGTPYLKGFLNNGTSGEHKHCAEMSYKKKFLAWNKNDCNKLQHFLCKYQP